MCDICYAVFEDIQILLNLMYTKYFTSCKHLCVKFTPSNLYLYIQSVQKETQTFKLHFLGVKIIDCKNYSISVALPFNKELYSEGLS